MSSEQLIQFVKEAKNGSSEAFEKIYKETYQEAYIIVCSIVENKNDIEDIVHDVYLKILLKLPELKNEASFKSWFKRIVVNTSKDYLIKKKPVLFSVFDSYDNFEDDFDQRIIDNNTIEAPLVNQIELEEISKRILRAINKLPEEQKLCVLMHYYSEMKVDEIASELGVSRNTVLSRLSYARKKLKKELGDDKDNRFFGVVLFPYVQSIEIAPEAMAVEISGEILAELMASAEAEALFASAGAGIIAKLAGLSVLQKIILIVSAVALIGGVAAFVIGTQINSNTAMIDKEQNEQIAQAFVKNTVNEAGTGIKAKAVTYSGGNLLLRLNGYMYFSDNGSIYRASGNITKREKIAEGNANNFVTDGKYIYFISNGLIHKYDSAENKVIQGEKTESEYIAFDGEDLYSVSVKGKTIYKINASLNEEKVKEINGSHIRFFSNSLTYYKQSDMYYAVLSNGALNEKKLIDGKSLKGMKLSSQVTDGKVYYPDFDSDETGKINVSSTNGITLYGIKLKRGFVDFGVCKDKILYSASDGGLYAADLNGESNHYIADGEYSFTSYSEPFALCYNSKNNKSVLINAENGEFTTLSSGYVKEFEYDSGVVFYSLKGENHIKEL